MRITTTTLKRALRTFIQSALAYVAVNAALLDYTGNSASVNNALIGLCVSALAAGLAAVMNLEKKDTAKK